MKALIQAELFRQLTRDREEPPRRRVQHAPADDVVLRSVPMLVAERDGVLVAALPLDGGQPIADPCARSADVVALLELRRAQLRPAA